MKSDREKEANAWPSWPVWRTARKLRDGAGEWNEWRKEGLEMKRTEAVESNSTWCVWEKTCEMCERDERRRANNRMRHRPRDEEEGFSRCGTGCKAGYYAQQQEWKQLAGRRAHRGDCSTTDEFSCLNANAQRDASASNLDVLFVAGEYS